MHPNLEAAHETVPEAASASDLKGRATLVLLPGLVAMAMGQTALFAVFGPAAREIGLPEWSVGAIVSAAAVAFVAGSIVWGRLSDRWGRKRVAVLALSAYALTSLGFAAVLDAGLAGALGAWTAFGLLLALRVGYGLLGSGLQPAATGYMADVSTREDRSAAVARIGAAFGIGTVLGPAAAAALAGFGLVAPLYAIGALGLACVALCVLALPEPPRVPAPPERAAEFRLAAIGPFLAIGLLAFLAVACLQQTTAFFVQDALRADAAAAAQASGLCFTALALAMVLMQAAVIPAWKPKPAALILAGLPIGLAGLAVFASGFGFAAFVAGCALMGCGFGLAIPGVNAAISLAVGPDAQGRAAGLGQAAASAGFVVGPFAGTALYGVEPLYAVALAGAAIAAALAVALAARDRMA